jgi:spore germination protein YaaH
VIPRSLTAVALAAGALLLPAAAPGGAQAATKCSTVKPTQVQLTQSKGAADRVIVSWRVPRRHPAKLAFRVARDGAVVGQTTGRRMSVAVPPGKAPKFTITAIVGGRPSPCTATVTARPQSTTGVTGAVAGLAVRPGARGRAVLSWDAPAGSKAAAYRILRNGRIAQRVAKPSLVVRATKRAVRYQVAALDGAGRRGPRSGAVTVQAGHRRPTKPVGAGASDVTDTSVTLSWGASRAPRGRIAGYRVLRDGRTVKGVQGTKVTLPKAAGARTLNYRVVALDTAGWVSVASDPITVTTAPAAAAAPGTSAATDAAPGRPGAPGADAVGDTTLSLSWSPAALPAGSVLRGYRLMRDGVIVSQVGEPRASVANLAPKSEHDWSVAAVDTRGTVSESSPATRVVQADPPPTTGASHAFLLASTDTSFAAFRRYYRQVGTVYPTFYDCNRGSGQVEGSNNPDIVRFAQDRKVKVLARFNCQSTETNHRILTEPALRETWLNTIMSLVAQHGYDGVNVDFEAVAAEDRDALTSFVADLSGRLHAAGKLLSQSVSAKAKDIPNHPRSTAFDYAALAQYNDYVFVMAWGLHWATSAPGPMDEINWVRSVADYAATMPHHEKFVIGTMLYGMDWAGDGGTDQPGEGRHYGEVQALSARYGAAPAFDPSVGAWTLKYTDDAGVPHTVWYPDANTTGDRVAIARERGLGVGFWRLGQEDDRVWTDARLPSAG